MCSVQSPTTSDCSFEQGKSSLVLDHELHGPMYLASAIRWKLCISGDALKGGHHTRLVLSSF